MMDEAMIAETVDYIAVQRLMASYADAVNRRAWAEFSDLFVEDARIEIMPSTRTAIQIVGPAALGEFIGNAILEFDFFQFAFLNSHIEFESSGTSARGRNFMTEMRNEKVSGRWTQVYGIYHDRFMKVDGRWYFAKRRYDALAAPGPDIRVFAFPQDMEMRSATNV